MSFYKALKILYMSHTVFIKAILMQSGYCCYCELDNFLIMFSSAVCTYACIFMIIHKNIKAVEFLFLFFAFVHVCVYTCVLFCFYIDSYTLKRNVISFDLLCICFI